MPCTPAVLTACEHRYGPGRTYRIGPPPSVSFSTLCQRFAELCNDPDHAWPRAYPCAGVCCSLKYPADADQAFFEGGYPHYKTGLFTTPGFVSPDHMGLRDGRLRVSKVGWLSVVSLRVAITSNRMSAGKQNIGQGHLPASDGARHGLRPI